MSIDKGMTVEEALRGSLMVKDPIDVKIALSVNSAIDFHVMPQLMLVYDELSGLICHFENKEVHEKACAFLGVLSNAIRMLGQIENELEERGYRTTNEQG